MAITLIKQSVTAGLDSSQVNLYNTKNNQYNIIQIDVNTIITRLLTWYRASVWQQVYQKYNTTKHFISFYRRIKERHDGRDKRSGRGSSNTKHRDRSRERRR